MKPTQPTPIIPSAQSIQLSETIGDLMRVLDNVQELWYRATPEQRTQLSHAEAQCKAALHSLRLLTPQHRPALCIACQDARNGGVA